jgi:thiol:disulfide interchange protein/DsbC/DsbD-like thiol-disulfide interchange protein
LKAFVLRKFALLVGLLGLALPWFGAAQGKPDGNELVKASLISDASSIAPGQKFRVGILYRIEPGWHIYWKHPGDSGIPTKIEWRLPEGFKAEDLQWPIPVREKEPGDLEVFVYENEVLLFATVVAPENLPAGPVEIGAKSDWLVCQSSCVPGSAQLSLQLKTGASSGSDARQIFDKYSALLPKSLPSGWKATFARTGKNLQLQVTGVPSNTPIDFFPVPREEAALGHVSSSGDQVTIPIDSEPQPISKLPGVLVVGSGETRTGYLIDANGASVGSIEAPAVSVSLAGLFQILGLAILGGLILNVMPCVLPVISLKIFGFVSEAGERPDKAFRLSMAFSVGILSCFAVLAVVAILLRAAGAQVGWGFQFQDYRFVVAIACVVFAFALNLFGVYEFSVSAKSTGGLAKLASGTGYNAAFFQGVFATILATPCTAPFLGTASAFAFAQPAWVTFLVFMFIGLGMASPYLILAINPKWLHYLPKPGRWMVRMKQFMGFLLIATLLWLAWVLGQMKGANAIISLGAVLLVIAIIAWIKGSFWTPVSPIRAKISAAISMLVVVLLAAGAYGFLTKPSQLTWAKFSKSSLDQAVASGRPVFVDFTADWCITCKTNERFAIDTPQVRDAFSKNKVVLLKADWTNGDPQITEILRQHGRAGVPMYLVYPGGSKEPILLSEVISSQTILDALNKGPVGFSKR